MPVSLAHFLEVVLKADSGVLAFLPLLVAQEDEREDDERG